MTFSNNLKISNDIRTLDNRIESSADTNFRGLAERDAFTNSAALPKKALHSHKNRLCVFLLSYRRPEYIKQTIDSILSQDYNDFCLIVSDNSGNDTIIPILNTYLDHPKFSYISQTPSLGPIEHLNHLIKLGCQFEFFMMFHDDDTLKPGCINQFIQTLDTYPEVAAVGCNAIVINENNREMGLFCPWLKKDFLIRNQGVIIKSYLSAKMNHVPFPSYIYRSSAVRDISLNETNGAKHCDASFIAEIGKHQSLYWIALPLMNYRRHQANGSVTSDIDGLLKLAKFYFKATPQNALLILIFLIKNYLKNIIQRVKLIFS